MQAGRGPNNMQAGTSGSVYSVRGWAYWVLNPDAKQDQPNLKSKLHKSKYGEVESVGVSSQTAGWSDLNNSDK